MECFLRNEEGKIMDNKPRRPWLAAVLTLLETGLGHIYAGNPKRGIVLYCIAQCPFLVFAVSLTAIVTTAVFRASAILAVIAFAIYCVVDAVLIARRRKENYRPAKYNRWFVYVGYLLVAGLLGQACASFIVTPYLIQAFKMPTGSMEPTLLIGDHILVDKHIYRANEPQRGDVIVFRYPRNPETAYVKRLIGEPGDMVEMVGRTVCINGKPIVENYAQYIDPGSINAHYGPYRVPPGQFFVMGDNRDASQDSRFWGFVPRENLLGKPLIIYWSFEIGRESYLPESLSRQVERFIGNLLKFFSKTRWHRTFQAIQ